MARAMPVFPEVESMIVFPGRSAPLSRPSRTMLSAARSFTEPPGLKPSSLARIFTERGSSRLTFPISTIGVLPTRSRTDGASGVAGCERALSAVALGMARGSAPAGDRGDDRDFVVARDRGLEVGEEADVVAVDVDVDEPPHSPVGLAEPVLDARITGLHIGNDLRHGDALGGDLFRSARELS